MPEVLVDNDDITVLGPPTEIDLLVDIGPEGTRGSQVFIGTGDPNSVGIGQTPELNDLFINTSPGADYGYLYQYVSEPGGDVWIEVLKINPTIFSKNYSVVFSSGAGSITIPVDDITAAETAFTAENFSVQYSIAHNNPTASSIEIPRWIISFFPSFSSVLFCFTDLIFKRPSAYSMLISFFEKPARANSIS